MAIDNSHDLIVLGAGCAGSFAAFLFAQQGFKVALVDFQSPRSQIHGITERTVSALHQNGLRELNKHLYGSVMRRAFWNQTLTEFNKEYLLDRAEFDLALRERAIEAGVNFIEGKAQPIHEETDDVRVSVKPVKDGDTQQELSCDYILDARGRAAPSDEKAIQGPLAWAFGCSFTWSCADIGTWVLPLDTGWVWVASHKPHQVWVQFITSKKPAKTDGFSVYEDRRIAHMHNETTSFMKEHIGATLGEPMGEVVSRGSQMRLAASPIKGRVIKIGDAVAAMDPLSGHGLFWALSSALASVPTVKALMKNDQNQTRLAISYYEGRVSKFFWHQARLGRDFYREETYKASEEFWQERCNWPDEIPVYPETNQITINEQIVVKDGCLCKEDILLTPDFQTGLCWLAGLPVAKILRKISDTQHFLSREEFYKLIGEKDQHEAANLVYDWFCKIGVIEAGKVSGHLKDNVWVRR